MGGKEDDSTTVVFRRGGRGEIILSPAVAPLIGDIFLRLEEDGTSQGSSSVGYVENSVISWSLTCVGDIVGKGRCTVWSSVFDSAVCIVLSIIRFLGRFSFGLLSVVRSLFTFSHLYAFPSQKPVESL